MAILLKHVGDAASHEDGARVLVDRRQPRGAAKDTLQLRAWLPEIGPSIELQRWFAERPRQWAQFRRRYLLELRDEDAAEALSTLHVIAGRETTTTLLSSAKNQEQSHAAILRDLLGGVKKPPSTSGPTRDAGSGRVQARRPR